MKLQPDLIQTQAITGYGEDWIAVNGEKYTRSLLISSSGLRLDWPFNDPKSLTAAAFDELLNLELELVIYGSGSRLQFPSAQCLTPLNLRGIGVETMDTKAACRTYNILASEGRRVAAALLVQTPTSAPLLSPISS
jgi:uncharacterized protein